MAKLTCCENFAYKNKVIDASFTALFVTVQILILLKNRGNSDQIDTNKCSITTSFWLQYFCVSFNIYFTVYQNACLLQFKPGCLTQTVICIECIGDNITSNFPFQLQRVVITEACIIVALTCLQLNAAYESLGQGATGKNTVGTCLEMHQHWAINFYNKCCYLYFLVCQLAPLRSRLCIK